VRTLKKSHQLLKSIWRTPVLKEGLRKFFGCSWSHLYAVLAGERPNPLERVCVLIDLSFVADPTGKAARRLAEHPRSYLRSLVREQAAAESGWNNHAAANELLHEASEAIAKLNSLSMNALDPDELEAARKELRDVQQVVRKQLARVEQALLHAPGRVRQLPVGGQSAARGAHQAREASRS